jgi:hypothetical protein
MARPQLAVRGGERRKAGIARRKIVFFLVPGRLRNMALAVMTDHLAVGVDHDDGIEQGHA